jgi:hypothetical protein
MIFVMVTACMWLVTDMRDGGHLEGGERYHITCCGCYCQFCGEFSLHEGAIVDVFYKSSDNFRILMCPDIRDRCKSTHH